MRTLVTYCRMTLLAVALLTIPILAQAQVGAGVARERDSLINLISQEHDASRLAVLHYQLAERYDALQQYPKLLDAADKAVRYCNECKDYNILYKAYILRGKYYGMKGDAVNAIQQYLSARSALEKKYNEARKRHNEEQIRNGVPKENIKELERPTADTETEADIVMEIGKVYFGRGHYIHSIDDFSDALITYESIGADDKAISAKSLLAISYCKRNDYESALDYYEQLLDAYKQRNDWEGTMMIYQRINEVSVALKDYDKVLEYNRALYTECIAHNNIRESYNALNNIAYTHVCLGDYENAARYYNQLIDVDPKTTGDERFMAGNYTNLGLCYQNMGDDAKAVEYLKKAAELHKRHSETIERSTVENIIALIYLKNHDLHNADHYSKEAIKDAQNADDSDAKKAAYQTYNKVLQEMGEYAEALKYYQNFLSIRDSVQSQRSFEESRMSEDLKKLTDAETRYQEDLAQQEKNELDAENYQLQLDRQEAELKRLQQTQKLQELQRQRDAEIAHQREVELQNQIERQKLERERAIQQLELERQQLALERSDADKKAAQEKQRALQAENDAKEQQLEAQTLKEQNMRYLLYLAGVAILGALAFVLVVRKKNSRLKAQQAEIAAKNDALQMKNDEIVSINQEITKQKAVIEEANKQMTDSIVYAKRIQNAVAPSPSFLSKYNIEYFMFFRPRDIVSGDYYWFYADSQQHLFIVAADCTGHGVPGAFMSMLGVSLFNKIVAERQILQPDTILNEMRKEVKLALHQDSINSSQKDGMDLSLVRIDLDTMMMHFAAANNNGYLLQEFDESEREIISKDLQKPEHLREIGNGKLLKLTIMPADPMPIGVYLREKESFTMTSYQLRKGDTFVLTSDGYVDQFGGKYGRKFLSRNFIKLLMDIHDKPMAAQESILIDTHENWRGLEYDQLDDIIVIGARV